MQELLGAPFLSGVVVWWSSGGGELSSNSSHLVTPFLSARKSITKVNTFEFK